jgi:hypothetical protein
MIRERSGRLRRRAPAVAVAALALCASLAAGALAASTNFVEFGTSPEAAGDGPASTVAADLDGDGDRDLATVNQNGEDVTILKNAGSGNFNQPGSSPEPVGGLPDAIVAADFDGDLDTDLAVSNFASGDVNVLLNRGTGNFTEPASSPEPAGGAPDELTVADLDGDLDQDLAVANSGSDDVTILRNNGLGDFDEPTTSPEAAGDDPRSVGAGDFDADGDHDLAVANADADTVTILRNNGSGNFSQTATSPVATGDGPQTIDVGDLDGDSDLDLAVGNGNAGTVTILKNTGSGNFSEPASSPEAAGSRSVWVVGADFDLDGDRDLANADFLNDQVNILRNSGSGNFNQPASSPETAGDAAFGIAVGDFDGDTDEDLAVANVNSDNLTILRNAGTPP